MQQEMGLKLLRWVGQSPDLNPMENAWAEFERRLRRREEAPRIQADLSRALQEEWRAIREAYFF